MCYHLHSCPFHGGVYPLYICRLSCIPYLHSHHLYSLVHMESSSSHSEPEHLSSDGSDVEEPTVEEDAAPIFEDDMSGNLVAFAEELDAENDDLPAPTNTITLQYISLDDLRTEDPLDALPFFWQPARNTNHCLSLAHHPAEDNLRSDNIKIVCHLDFLLAIGKNIGLEPIIIESGLSGQSLLLLSASILILLSHCHSIFTQSFSTLQT